MADETLVINLKIDATQSAKTIEELTKRNKELAKVIKQAPREGTEEFKKMNKELKAAQQEFAKNRQEINEFNRSLRETDVADDSLKGLSRQLRRLEKEYKELGKAAREDAFGRRLQGRIRSTRGQLKKLEGDIGDQRRNVGNYGKAWQKAGSQISGVGRATGIALAASLAIEGIQKISEIATRFEKLRQTITEFAGAAGEELDRFAINIEGIAGTFGVESDEIAAAARTLSSELGISFDQAIQTIESGFLAGANSSGNFLSSLESLAGEAAEAGVSAESFAAILQQSAVNGVDANKELIKSFKDTTTEIDDLVDASSDFTKQQMAQLEASKSLAATQNNLSKQLSGSAAGLKLVGTNIADFVLQAFSGVIEAVSPVIDAFKSLFSSLGSLGESFQSSGEKGSVWKGILNALLTPIRLLAKGITFIVGAVTSLVDGVKDYIDQSPFLQKVIESARTAFGFLKTAISSIPAVFAGIIAAAKQAGTNIVNFFKKLAIDVQLIFQRIQEFNPFGPTQETIDATIANLQAQRQQLEDESIGIFEAFGNAFNESIAAQNELADELPEKTAEAGAKIETELEKAFRDGTKKGISSAKKEIEAIAETGSLKALSDIIKPLKEEFDRLAVGSEAFKDKLEELVEAENALAEAEEKVKAARETDAERQARIEKALADQEAANKKFEEQARQSALEANELQLQATILRLSEERNLELQNADLTAEQKLEIERQFEIELLNLTIETEKERQSILQEGSAEQIASKQAVIDAELTLLQGQIEKEDELSQQRIERVKNEEAEKLALREASEKAAFQVAKTFADLAFGLAKQKAENEKNAELKEVRAEFAEKLRLAQGNASEEELLKQQQANAEAEIEKKAAQKKKALALVQAVINGALAALQTIANLGFPLAIPGLIAVAAVVGANIATIASQKLEKGGLAKRKKRRFGGGGLAPGRRHRDGGTPAIIGGQELIEIEVGEGITNRKSTRRFLQTLSDINQAEGGVRYEGTSPLSSKRLAHLTALEMMSSSMPTIAERGLSPRLSQSVRRTFQAGGVSSVQSASASIGQEVEFQGRILTEEDVKLIARAAAEGTKAGIEAANLFGQFRRQAERQINQNNRSKV